MVDPTVGPVYPIIPRHKTAIIRTGHSKPVALALAHEVLRKDTTVFDYGCGRGADVDLLRQAGIEVRGWDPEYHPDVQKQPADVVNLGYVINVIEAPEERKAVLAQAYHLAKRCLVVSAQIQCGAAHELGNSFSDGVLTRRGTFQKYFTQEGLRQFVEATLQVEAVAASLGVFYVFREEADRQAFLLRQVVRRESHKTYTQIPLEEQLAPYRSALEAFANHVELLGRIPRPSEFPGIDDLTAKIGTPHRCVKLCERLIGGFSFAEARNKRRQDLLVYLALSRFGRRPRFSDLPDGLQWDIRDLFGSYTKACEEGDELLFRVGKADVVNQSCASSKVGKLLPDDLYVHVSALESLDPVLRVYIGCGRAAVGEVEEANIIKIHRHSGKVSFLSYPKFDRDPHPALVRGLRVNLRTREVWLRDYTKSANPPILHRKETFVGAGHPLRPKFEVLSQMEEAAGLLDSGKPIGFASEWAGLLEERGYRIRGHRLCRKRGSKRRTSDVPPSSSV